MLEHVSRVYYKSWDLWFGGVESSTMATADGAAITFEPYTGCKGAGEGDAAP